MYVILVYDISNDENGQRVWSRVFKICKKYLNHIQNSVFEGQLTEYQIMEIKTELSAFIRKDIDSVILFKSRNEKWLKKELWGMQEDRTTNFI